MSSVIQTNNKGGSIARKKHKQTQKEHLAVEKRFDQFVATTVTRLQNFCQRNVVIIRAWAVFALMLGLFTTLLLVLGLGLLLALFLAGPRPWKPRLLRSCAALAILLLFLLSGRCSI